MKMDVFPFDTPTPLISSTDLLATDRVLLALRPDLLSITQSIRSQGFVRLPGKPEALHYSVILPIGSVRDILRILRGAEVRSPEDSAAISRLVHEWTTIDQILELAGPAREASP